MTIRDSLDFGETALPKTYKIRVQVLDDADNLKYEQQLVFIIKADSDMEALTEINKRLKSAFLSGVVQVTS